MSIGTKLMAFGGGVALASAVGFWGGTGWVLLSLIAVVVWVASDAAFTALGWQRGGHVTPEKIDLVHPCEMWVTPSGARAFFPGLAKLTDNELPETLPHPTYGIVHILARDNPYWDTYFPSQKGATHENQ